MIYEMMKHMDWALCAMLWATLVCTLPDISIFDALRPTWQKDEKRDCGDFDPLWLRLIRSVLFILAVGATAHMVSSNGLCS